MDDRRNARWGRGQGRWALGCARVDASVCAGCVTGEGRSGGAAEGARWKGKKADAVLAESWSSRAQCSLIDRTRVEGRRQSLGTGKIL